MGMMPEDRSRRWRSIFRRYGIPSEAEPETDKAQEAAAKLEQLRQDAERSLLPDARSHPGAKAKRKS